MVFLQVLRQCEYVSPTSSVKQINIRMLCSILQEELSLMQGSSTAGQRQLIQQEIQVSGDNIYLMILPI